MNLPAFIALARKDLVLYFTNRRALVMSIAAPIVIAAFFGSLFGSDQKPSRVPVAVTDLDHSALSGKLVANLRGDTTFELQELDEAAAAEQVSRATCAQPSCSRPGSGGRRRARCLAARTSR
jgi:ABC-2 type transport system permease protein